MRPREMSTLLAIGCVLSLVGCSSSSPGTPSASVRSQSTLGFSECMRADGVTDFPDPGLKLSGSFNSLAGIEFPATINPSSPAFQAAQTACAKLLPGGGPGSQQPPAGFIERMREVSVCMRERGVTGFPDPTFTRPSNPAGYSMVSDEDGVVVAVPRTINPEAPAFKNAAAACNFLLLRDSERKPTGR